LKNRTEKNGSKNNNWATPDWLLKEVISEFGKVFDPCPLDHDLKLWDGLKINWCDVNFINPPYGIPFKDQFIKKAYEEWKKGKTCIMLIPSCTDTKTFHKYIWNKETHKPKEGIEVRFYEGRISFKGYNSKGKYTENGKGQSGSMLVVFK